MKKVLVLLAILVSFTASAQHYRASGVMVSPYGIYSYSVTGYIKSASQLRSEQFWEERTENTTTKEFKYSIDTIAKEIMFKDSVFKYDTTLGENLFYNRESKGLITIVRPTKNLFILTRAQEGLHRQYIVKGK